MYRAVVNRCAPHWDDCGCFLAQSLFFAVVSGLLSGDEGRKLHADVSSAAKCMCWKRCNSQPGVMSNGVGLWIEAALPCIGCA